MDIPVSAYVSVPVVGLILALMGVQEVWVYIVVGGAIVGGLTLMHNKK